MRRMYLKRKIGGKEEGYDTDSKVNTEFLWEEKTKQIIKDRMGVGDEDSDDDSDDGEGKIVGERKIVHEEKDDDDNDDDSKKGSALETSFR